MKIGILGTGHIGKTWPSSWSAAGHDVKVANSRGPETIGADVLASGARAVSSAEAVGGRRRGHPLHSPEPHPIGRPAGRRAYRPRRSSSTRRTTIRFRDGKIDAIEAGQVESLWVAEQLGRPVVKAWNSIGSDSFARKGTAPGSPGRIALSVAADREADRKVGMQLVEDTGFDAFDAGTLAESWRQQPGAPCYCTDLTLAELPAALATAEASRLPKRRDLAVAAIQERLGDSTTNPDAEYGVRLIRALFM